MEIDAKEKTALNPSVGADDRQSIQTTSANSIPNSEPEINRNHEKVRNFYQSLSDPRHLPTVTISELYDTAYRTKPPIIDNLLYPGTYLLAGAPKIGKSFLVAQIAYHVSTGQPLWGYPVRKSSVLYLALEDDYPRLQSRMYRMFGIDEEPGDLHFCITAKQIGNGLDEQLEQFLQEHRDTKLVIIDTLQRIREAGGDAYSYANDYEIIGKLKALADTHGICLLIVHHTRKQPAGDKFEMISGTTGLLGCADGALILHKGNRTDSGATLDIVGRDQPEQRLHLLKDEVRLIWYLDYAENEPWYEPPDPLLEAVATLVTQENPKWQGSATDLQTALSLDLKSNALTKMLNVRASKLENAYHIRYENRHSRLGSQITLTYQSPNV